MYMLGKGGVNWAGYQLLLVMELPKQKRANRNINFCMLESKLWFYTGSSTLSWKCTAITLSVCLCFLRFIQSQEQGKNMVFSPLCQVTIVK